MYECGTTEEQVGELVIQQRQNALANDKALKKEPLTLDDYLNDPKIADPYRTLDCGLITDGAGAYIVSSADYASSSPHDPVYVKGIGRGLDARLQESWITQHDPYTSIPADKSGPRAFEMAGVSPDDVDFAELYDCFSTIPFIQLENLGFCEKGQSGDFVENKGITVEDGELPINTHGGLLSQAYIMGMNHVIEGVRQIRGTADNQVEDADLGVVTGWGSNEHSTLILAGEEEQ
jgi:acetyl-CoA acetyltransferase